MHTTWAVKRLSGTPRKRGVLKKQSGGCCRLLGEKPGLCDALRFPTCPFAALTRQGHCARAIVAVLLMTFSGLSSGALRDQVAMV